MFVFRQRASARPRSTGVIALMGAVLLATAWVVPATAPAASVTAASVARATASASGTAAKATPDRNGSEPGVCPTCKPPLLQHSGVVLGTSSAPGAITVTPIYWVPSGYDWSGDGYGPYVPVINQYIADLAASGTFTNSLGVISEYTNTVGTPLVYSITAGAALTDTTPYTSASLGASCSVTTGFTACVTDAQLQTELAAFLKSKSLPTDLAHLYAVFFPPNVATAAPGGSSISCPAGGNFGGYHYFSTLPAGAGTIVYTNEPFLGNVSAGTLCGYNNTQPNNDPYADAEVSTLNHEIAEAVTDPLRGPGLTGWYDTAGNEIGDECNTNFGTPLGSITDALGQQSPYNQVINGHLYYVQTEFSNAAYAKNGVGKGCIRTTFSASSSSVTAAAQARAADDTVGGPSLVTLDASSSKLPADGTSTSTITVTALDANGDPVAGDHMLVSLMDDGATPGGCGTLSPADATGTTFLGDVKDVTDANGQAVATYTASATSGDCYVLATDTDQGTINKTVIYEGSDESTAPSVKQTVPTSVTVGGQTVEFSAEATNPSNTDIADARFDVFFSGDNSGATGLDASQLSLSYADAATGGKFVPVPLDGTTANDGEIAGFIVPDTAASLLAHGTRGILFRLSLAPGAPAPALTGVPLRIETDLDQFNPADGSQTNLDYAGPDDVPVNTETADRITFVGKVLTAITPTADMSGTSVLISEVCSLTSGGGCTVNGTASLSLSGGTLSGFISADPLSATRERSISFNVPFVFDSATTASGTGSGQEYFFDTGTTQPTTVTVAFKTAPTSVPHVESIEGVIITT